MLQGGTILDGAAASRSDVPFACKGGVCGTCRAKVVEGEVRMDASYALEPADEAHSLTASGLDVKSRVTHPHRRRETVSHRLLVGQQLRLLDHDGRVHESARLHRQRHRPGFHLRDDLGQWRHQLRHRLDEQIDIIRLVTAGGYAEYHGAHYDFDRLRMEPPAPPEHPIPIYVGGHSDAGMRRAARAGDGVSSIIIGGDMIGAHASLPSRAQLELSGNSIAPLHTIAALAPGESVVLKGEFKLALTAITPIRNGNAALFIPLARFRLEAIGKSALPFAVARTFVVGEDQDRPGAALKPFRLDLGPRLYSQIGQRELALSA